MLLVDYRETEPVKKGDHDLARSLRNVGMTVVSPIKLDFADVAFQGRGEKDTSVEVGVELKTLPDAISSLRTGRLAGHQMPGLFDLYGHNVWVVVEGNWSTNKAGIIVQQHWHGRRPEWRTVKGKMSGDELTKRLLTLELQYGCHVHFSTSRRNTVSFLVSLYRWWTDKSLDEHRSAMVAHIPSTVVPISAERRALAMWPGIGLEWSRAALATFGSVGRAAAAGVAEWAKLETTDRKGHTRRLGTPIAEKLVSFLRGRK